MKYFFLSVENIFASQNHHDKFSMRQNFVSLRQNFVSVRLFRLKCPLPLLHDEMR